MEAYGRDVRQFLAFLTERFRAPPTIADFAGLFITTKHDRSRRCTRRSAAIESIASTVWRMYVVMSSASFP
ncbi:MAG: hypothetical protein ABR878_09315 [Roseiarcus sp.]